MKPNRDWNHQRIVVLCGGSSAERDVSLRSGEAVAAALASLGHAVEMVDPADASFQEVNWQSFDIAFLAVHGTGGEDGDLQAELDRIGITYTGSGAAESRLAFSKSRTKRILERHGLMTPRGIHVASPEQAAAECAAMPLPWVIKPDRQGSSVGVSVVVSESEMSSAIALCFRHDDSAVIEEAIPGDEWTVSLLGERVLPPIRIETRRGFYDYRAKYEDDTTRYHFDADAALLAALGEVAQETIRALGLRGATRVDLRVTQAGGIFVLEANTIPGLTATSLLPKAAARAGISFPQLCEWMIADVANC